MKLLLSGIVLTIGIAGIAITGRAAAEVYEQNTVVVIGTKVFNDIYECEREYDVRSCKYAEAEAKKASSTDIRVPHLELK